MGNSTGSLWAVVPDQVAVSLTAQRGKEVVFPRGGSTLGGNPFPSKPHCGPLGAQRCQAGCTPVAGDYLPRGHPRHRRAPRILGRGVGWESPHLLSWVVVLLSAVGVHIVVDGNKHLFQHLTVSWAAVLPPPGGTVPVVSPQGWTWASSALPLAPWSPGGPHPPPLVSPPWEGL